MIISYFGSKSMENKNDNNDKNKECCGISVSNFIDDNFGISEKNKNSTSNNIKLETLFSKISAKIKNIWNSKECFKITFDLECEEKNNLLGVDINKFTIFIESEGKSNDNVFLTWQDENNIKNGMTLFEIKKNFLKYNRFYPNSDPFSFSVKLNNFY